MIRTTEFFINRKMWGDLLVAVIVILGITMTFLSRKEGFPELSLNKVSVITIYPGASAKDVEIDVTARIEKMLIEVEGIKETFSASEANISRIEIHAREDLSTTDFRRFLTDIENVVARVDDLPAGIQGKPIVSEITSANSPVFEVAYTGSYTDLKYYLEDVASRLRKLPGVSGVDLIGVSDEEIQIRINPLKARNASIGIHQIFAGIAGRNIAGSAGVIPSSEGEHQITVSSKFRKPEEVLDTILIKNDAGFNVRLKDIAGIDRVPEDRKLLVRNQGQRGAYLAVRKSGSADLLKTVDGIANLLNQETLPEGVNAFTFFDQSVLTRKRISLLAGNALMGFILVIFILALFLDRRAAFWAAFGIPLTLMGMLIVLYSLGISLNLISLAGFIIILGMLVDDAIVVTEEFITNRSRGMSGTDAALAAVKRMAAPVIASCATTMVAFAPLFAVGGFPGAFIWTIPLMVITGLLVSLGESFFILPSHLAHSEIKPTEKKKFINILELLYSRSLHFALKNKYKVVFFFISITIASFILMKFNVKKDPFPQDSAENFSISLVLPLGSISEKTEAAIIAIEQKISEVLNNDLVGISSRIGTLSLSTIANRGSQNNLATIFVYLSPYESREKTAAQLMAHLDKELGALSQEHQFRFSMDLRRIGPPMGKDIEVRLVSNNDIERQKAESEIMQFLSNMPGVSGVTSDRIEGVRQIQIIPLVDRLALTGLTSSDLMTALRMAIEGVFVTEIIENDQLLKFRLKIDSPISRGEKKLQQVLAVNSAKLLPITNQQGNMINLDSLVHLEQAGSEAVYNHYDGTRSTSVFANINLDTTSPVAVMDSIRKAFPEIPDVKMIFAGQPAETKAIFSDLTLAAFLAIAGIYIIIALIFNSYRRPAVIMMSLPFISVGVVFALLVHNIPGSMMVGIAIVGLMGVVVNASIVLVDTIYNIQKDSLPTLESIIEGARSRLRPVIMSVLTTALGVLPTGYGIGGYDPFLSHMSLVLAYGLLFSTAIILIIVPLFLAIGLEFRIRRD